MSAIRKVAFSGVGRMASSCDRCGTAGPSYHTACSLTPECSVGLTDTGQTGTFRLCFTRFSVKLVTIDCTFGSSTMAFFTVAS